MWQTPLSTVSPENDTPRDSSLRTGRRDVLDLQRDGHAVRADVDPLCPRPDHGDRHVAGLELGAGRRLVPALPQR